ncbi:MAG: Rpp14/Pop5 family protein [Candidatus Micrarchaeia archaeon]
MGVKKSLRTAFRYIRFVFVSATPVAAKDMEEHLRQHLHKMLGLLNSPKIKLFSTGKENEYVLRCDSASFAKVRQALLFFYGKDYRIKLLKSSGTIKSLGAG